MASDFKRNLEQMIGTTQSPPNGPLVSGCSIENLPSAMSADAVADHVERALEDQAALDQNVDRRVAFNARTKAQSLSMIFKQPLRMSFADDVVTTALQLECAAKGVAVDIKTIDICYIATLRNTP